MRSRLLLEIAVSDSAEAQSAASAQRWAGGAFLFAAASVSRSSSKRKQAAAAAFAAHAPLQWLGWTRSGEVRVFAANAALNAFVKQIPSVSSIDDQTNAQQQQQHHHQTQQNGTDSSTLSPAQWRAECVAHIGNAFAADYDNEDDDNDNDTHHKAGTASTSPITTTCGVALPDGFAVASNLSHVALWDCHGVVNGERTSYKLTHELSSSASSCVASLHSAWRGVPSSAAAKISATSIALLEKGCFVAIGDEAGRIFVEEAPATQSASAATPLGASGTRIELGAHAGGAIACLCIARFGEYDYVISAGADCLVKLWRINALDNFIAQKSSRAAFVFRNHTTPIHCLQTLSDARLNESAWTLAGVPIGDCK